MSPPRKAQARGQGGPSARATKQASRNLSAWPCFCRVGARCITCAAWKRLYRRLQARRAAWGAA